MSSKETSENIITIVTRGEVRAGVFVEETPVDRFRYATYRLERRCYSNAGKELRPRQNFFEYNTDDLMAAAKEAAATCKRYQANPKKTLEELGGTARHVANGPSTSVTGPELNTA